MEYSFNELQAEELSNVEGGALLGMAIVALGAVDILLTGYVVGYGVTLFTA